MAQHPATAWELLGLVSDFPEAAKQMSAEPPRVSGRHRPPQGLKGDQLDSLTQIVSPINEVRQPLPPLEAKVPYAALGSLYKQRKSQFNADHLGMLIRLMGVYPRQRGAALQRPGGAGDVGQRLPPALPCSAGIRPRIPRQEAAIIDPRRGRADHRQGDPAQTLPPAVFEYLNPAP